MRTRDWYELSFGDDSEDDAGQCLKPSLNANDASLDRDSHKVANCDSPQDGSKHTRQYVVASLNKNTLDVFNRKAHLQDASCWEHCKTRSEISSCCSTSTGDDIPSRGSSSSDIPPAHSRTNTLQRHRKRDTRYSGPNMWYNFVELAGRVEDIEVNDHPCIWLSALLKQRFPITRDGKEVPEIPSKLVGCQGNNLGNKEQRAYASVSVAVNPVLNAGRLAILFASKALAGQGSSVPALAVKIDEKLGVAFEFLEKIPRARAKVCDLFDLRAADVSLSKQFWSGLCEKFKEINDAPDPCSRLIAVPVELLDIWVQAQSSSTEVCQRSFVKDVARWVTRITQLFENDPCVELDVLLFPKSMIPVISGKRAARASMLGYFVKHDAVRRVLEWKI